MPRPPTSREEAAPLIEALLARRFDGELPPPATANDYLGSRGHLWQLPLVQTLPLHGRALFAPDSLSPEAREQALWGREDFFAELGAAVGVSARVMHAAIVAGSFPLVPPRALANYEYLGAFTCNGELDIADPCHLRKTSLLPPEIWALSFAVAALKGQWHAFVRDGDYGDERRTAELAVIHAEGFTVMATRPIVTIGVDAGMMGVFDRRCPVPESDDLHVEGVVRGLGAFSKSGAGDGLYPVFAGYVGDRVAKLRLAFLDERPEIDRALPVGPSKRYAVSATFEVGDRIEHAKFGGGTVVAVSADKIRVQFEDDTRTLVHARG